MDEAALLAKAQRGSEEAFTGLVRLHQGAVRAYLGRWTRDRDMCDDLAQEVFVTAYRNLASFRGDSSLRTWLLGIARNQGRVHLRAEQRRLARHEKRLALELSRWQAARLEEQDPLELDEERDALHACLAKLPARTRELVEAHYFKGEAAAAIADDLGRKASAVRMNLMRARQTLRACMDQRLAAGRG